MSGSAAHLRDDLALARHVLRLRVQHLMRHLPSHPRVSPGRKMLLWHIRPHLELFQELVEVLRSLANATRHVSLGHCIASAETQAIRSALPGRWWCR
eukprot:1225328-Rhodomonas_salina.4